jgi:hypothetical protein
MNKNFESKFGSIVFDRINTVRMSETERQMAINAMLDADMIADALLWVVHKFEQLGTLIFAKPSLKL